MSEEKALSDEDERISILSNKISRQNTHHSNTSVIMIPMSRHHTAESVHRGSFYGRRDFENKHDDSAEIVGSSNLGRKPSKLDNVLTKIKSMRGSMNSDESEVDDDDDDYYYDGLEN